MREKGSGIILTLFFFSGLSGLIYEVAWSRLLVVLLGTTTTAVTATVSAFMGGLALGGRLGGRLADRAQNPLFLYGLVEAGIGISAAFVPAVSSAIIPLYPFLAGLSGVGQFIIAYLILLIPTTLMGVTLPVISRVGYHGTFTFSTYLGSLYAVNTFGATLGCLIATFFSLEWLGVSWTVYAGVVINLLVGGVACWKGRNSCGFRVAGSELKTRNSKLETRNSKLETGEVKAERGRGLILWLIGLSGAVALGYQILWTRTLAFAFANNTLYAFGTILAAFLVGIAGGGAIGGRLRTQSALRLFGWVEVGIGFTSIISMSLLVKMPSIVSSLTFRQDSWESYALARFLAGLIPMLVPTLLMGITFPLAAQIRGEKGRHVGEVYAANTIGAIVGAIVTGFVLITLTGTGRSLLILTIINLLIGMIAIVAGTPQTDRAFKGTIRFLSYRAGVITVIPMGLIGIMLFFRSTDVLRALAERADSQGELIYYNDRYSGTVAVYRRSTDRYIMTINGGGQVSTSYTALQTFQLLGHLPFFVHPQVDDVLVIALGGGISLGAVTTHHPRRIDCVEIVPGLSEAARLFIRWNRGIVDRLPEMGVRLIDDDGRNYLLRTDRRYDVITGDATHPGSADSWVLYTTEFYDLCKAHLKPDGVIVQWLPMHGLSVADYRIVIRTFLTVFPHASLWLTGDYTILLGTSRRLVLDVPALKRRLRSPEVLEGLGPVNLDNLYMVLNCFVMGEEALVRYAGAGPINTDDRPLISFYERRRYGTGRGIPALTSIGGARQSPLPFLTGYDEATEERIRRYDAARLHVTMGEIYRKKGMTREAVEEYRAALKIEPEEKNAAYFLEQLTMED